MGGFLGSRTGAFTAAMEKLLRLAPCTSMTKTSEHEGFVGKGSGAKKLGLKIWSFTRQGSRSDPSTGSCMKDPAPDTLEGRRTHRNAHGPIFNHWSNPHIGK